MSFKLHENVESLPASTLIWRYMNLSKLISMLRCRCLHFSTIQQLRCEGDIYEGGYTAEELSFLRDERNLESDEHENSRLRRHFSDIQGINCWSISEAESVLMWHSYVGSETDGIVIQSNIGSLCRSLQATDKLIDIRRVEYPHDIQSEVRRSDPPTYASIFYKHLEYRDERELRLVYSPYIPTDTDKYPNLAKYTVRMSKDVGKDAAHEDNLKEAAKGAKKKIYEVAVALRVLIKKIYVAPHSPAWVDNIVRDLVKDAWLDPDLVEPSALRNSYKLNQTC